MTAHVKRPAVGRPGASGLRSFSQNNLSRSKEPHCKQQLLIVEPVGRDRFAARLDGRLLATSRTPFCDAARALIAEGADPSTILIMRHAGSEIDALRARLSVAARLTVEERPSGGPPRFARYRPQDPATGSPRTPRTAADGPAGTSLPEAGGVAVVSKRLPEARNWPCPRRASIRAFLVVRSLILFLICSTSATSEARSTVRSPVAVRGSCSRRADDVAVGQAVEAVAERLLLPQKLLEPGQVGNVRRVTGQVHPIVDSPSVLTAALKIG
jgi:hypothetical protein